jgi:Phosphodiester glycosidase
LADEAIWQPYIYTPKGEVAAVRTFLQPDAERPYAIVAVAAFDLLKVQLHYVLGLKEPSKPGGPHGWGLIPDEDKQPGKLLAAFNGGFIAEHGNYGAMADGIIPIALRQGLATLAIYKDSAVRIGEWGIDLQDSTDYAALRQNALPIIHNGEINPKVYTGTWVEWGANLDYSIETLRSGVGISKDNQVLYYFAGPGLSMPVLADAMDRAGVHNSMLLDINPTHAHFTAMRVMDGQLTAEPLYEQEMSLWVDRYLRQWDLDFFYVIARE